AGTGWLLSTAITGNSDKPVRAIALGSAVAGTIAGATLGQSLSDAEAHAGGFGIHVGAATGLGLSAAFGMSSRGMSAVTAIGGIAGYPIGGRYPRGAWSTVTAGDGEA